MMKTIQIDQYGDSAVLKLREIDLPSCTEKQVLIRIQATSINPLDIKIRKGDMKSVMPVDLPFVLGLDLSGIIVNVGEKVEDLKVGDKVFATTFGGTYSEYISLDENVVCKMPDGIGFNEAAALAIPLTTSYSLLLDEAHLQAGQTVLIYGGAGGVGHILIQMAKYIGATVFATATGSGMDFIKSVGSDKSIDYKINSELEKVTSVDLVVDLVGGETHFDLYKKVKKGGLLLTTVMPVSEKLASQLGIKAKFVNAVPGVKKLEFGKRLIEHKNITVKIARSFDFEDVSRAHDCLSEGGIKGKIVLNVGKQ